jgi:cysteine-rich repeat protein
MARSFSWNVSRVRPAGCATEAAPGHAGRGALALAAIASLLVLFAWSLAHAAPGNVTADQKISDTAGNFAGTLDDNDFFGRSVASLGDLDGDDVNDIAVGAPDDDDGGGDRGAVWILFMNTDGTVKSFQKISDTAGGFSGALDNGDEFGSSVGSVGDLDGDGVVDLAVGAIADDDGGTDRGAVWILFLNTNGSVKTSAKISDTTGNFGGALSNGDNFGRSVGRVGDIDGNGSIEVAVGAAGDDDGGTDRGAVWLLSLGTNGAVQSQSKLSSAGGILGGLLSDFDAFGTSVTGIGDTDGDGIPDLAAGAPGDDDGGAERGAFYVIELNADGTAKLVQKVSDTAGNFLGTLDNSDQFGSAVASVRDLDGDGVNDLAVGSPGDDDGGINRGAVFMLLMNSNGTVKTHRKISSLLGGFTGPLANGDNFGVSAVSPRDLNGDGVADLVVGADRTDDGGAMRGAVWVLILDGVPGAFCGDGYLDPGEQCDDGNKDNGDCCSSTCTLDPNGTPCPDGDVCTGDELCDGAGVCQPGVPLVCDDGEPCTQNSCDPVLGCQFSTGPATSCKVAAKSKFEVRDKADDAKDKLRWKWIKGEELLFSELGAPSTTSEYALCVYDTSSGTPDLVSSLVIPPNAFWQPKKNGFKYKDKTLTNDGVQKITLKIGSAGKAKADLKAKGVNLPTPAPFGPSQFFEQDPSVTVQLINSDGTCLTSEFTGPANKNDGQQFKDKAP